MHDAITTNDLGKITLEEIVSQPECWERAQEKASLQPGGLPASGDRVLVLGCGTSYYLAAAYAWIREQRGGGVTDAIIASELPPELRDYDRVVVISRSGTTTEVLQAMRKLPPRMPVTAILGELGTPIEAAATDVIDMSFADERSVVQTRFPTTLLTFLRASLGESPATIDQLVARARDIVRTPAAEPIPRQLVVLASGWATPLAQEAALKCREAAGLWAEAYATGEYRHGPISAAGEGTLVWAMTQLTDVQVSAIAATGARVRQGHDDPQVELVAIQTHAVTWAAAAGRNADVPAYLSRSVLTL